MKNYQHILCATDFSSESDKACIRASAIAKASGGALTLLHVVDHFPEDRSNREIPPEDVDPRVYHEQKSLADLESQSARTDCTEAKLKVILSPHSVAREVVEYARDNKVDLILMASHSHTAIAELFGTTENRVEHNAPCEVLILPSGDTG